MVSSLQQVLCSKHFCFCGAFYLFVQSSISVLVKALRPKSFGLNQQFIHAHKISHSNDLELQRARILGILPLILETEFMTRWKKFRFDDFNSSHVSYASYAGQTKAAVLIM